MGKNLFRSGEGPLRLGSGKPEGEGVVGCRYCDAKTGFLWTWKHGKWVRFKKFDSGLDTHYRKIPDDEGF
jgi:hypothetical protein